MIPARRKTSKSYHFPRFLEKSSLQDAEQVGTSIKSPVDSVSALKRENVEFGDTKGSAFTQQNLRKQRAQKKSTLGNCTGHPKSLAAH